MDTGDSGWMLSVSLDLLEMSANSLESRLSNHILYYSILSSVNHKVTIANEGNTPGVLWQDCRQITIIPKPELRGFWGIPLLTHHLR